MSDYIRVAIDRIEQDKSTIQSEVEGIRSSVMELYQEMQSLGATWEGPAWQAFQNQVAEDIENMQMIETQIRNYLEHMDYAGKEYKQCSGMIRQLVNSIRV
mgnify:CR=1 FL=1